MQAAAAASHLGSPSRSTIPTPVDGLDGRDADGSGSVSERPYLVPCHPGAETTGGDDVANEADLDSMAKNGS